jgi:prefoldin subunit 5
MKKRPIQTVTARLWALEKEQREITRCLASISNLALALAKKVYVPTKKRARNRRVH